jgi:hypothetical protein
VNFITATNRDLPAAIASGTFRADLFTFEYFPNPRAAFAEPEGRHSDAGRVTS